MLKSGDAVWLHIGGNVRVGYILDMGEVRALNGGEMPAHRKGRHPWVRVQDVEKARTAVHFFGTCGGVDRTDLSWGVVHTTCRHCLMERARFLRGWRWTSPGNAEEVAHIKAVLGERVDGFERREGE